MNGITANNMLLSICIPTYNRSEDLIKNLQILENQILNNRLERKVDIIVSDNNSTDDTKAKLLAFAEKTHVNITTLFQKKNTGAEINQLIVGEASNSSFILLLGDDDYLDGRYLPNVIKALEENSNLKCIIPNYNGITPLGEFISSRDPMATRKYYKKGFESCLANSWKAHQLSGLVFAKGDVYEVYHRKGVHNLYPQIFLLSYNLLKGDCLYMPEYPTLVTHIPQVKKDWSYGKDGLIGDIFDNYMHLDLSQKQVSQLQKDFLRRNAWRVTINPSILQILSAVFRVTFHKNTVYRTRLFCMWFFPLFILKCAIERLLRPKKLKLS